MDFQENVSLQALNTFHIDAYAKYFQPLSDIPQIQEFLAHPLHQTHRSLILGGGSNILLVQDFDGIVGHIQTKGIQIVEQKDPHILIEAQAGEVWHDLVSFCVQKGYAGIENLSLIPGSVGAAPIQNIGAYGVELKDVFHSLQAVEIASGKLRSFSSAECEFGYRNSVFKHKLRGKYIITSVTLKLSTVPSPNTNYGSLEKELQKMRITDPSIQTISDTVCKIRRSKLPDPQEIGNAGSFFKNPEISQTQFEELKSHHSDIVGYPLNGGSYKLAAGWLIEKAGWKGYRMDDFGVHKNQALVLVNYNNAKGMDIFKLSDEIKHSVKDKFGVALEREVNIIH